jgi:hypothetical protein
MTNFCTVFPEKKDAQPLVGSPFVTFPVRAFHALLPLCPSMESPSSTPPAPKNDIISKHQGKTADIFIP